MQRKKKLIFSFLILFIGLFIFCSEYFASKKIAVYDYMNELYYESDNKLDEDIADVKEIIEELDSDKEDNGELALNTGYSFNNNDNNSIYIGYLTIPDINLKKGFTEKTSKYNTISRNIQILSSSDYPDKENGNVIFAAHSGNSSVSYFNKLYLLNNGAQVHIDYNSVKYIYKIVNIYTVPKSGQVEIKRNKNISSITLITCTKDDNSTQTVYIGELINKE